MVAYVAQGAEQVFDPAAGRGAFFAALNSLQLPNVSYYGTDIDADVLNDSIYQDATCLVERRDFIKTPPQQLFDAIVANPPYIRHHRLDEETKAFLKKRCLQITGFTIDGRAGYHIYFLLQALSQLKPGGRLAFIIPADTCEGKFATQLWQWITQTFRLECIVTFDEEATPFPNVDTNAIIFFIRNEVPGATLQWAKITAAHTNDLWNFVEDGFPNTTSAVLTAQSRQLDEALRTGLSRPAQIANQYTYCLGDFARVMRGIATGANEFFFLTKQQAQRLNLPQTLLRQAVGRTRDVTGDCLTAADLTQLDREGRPTQLLSIEREDQVTDSVHTYLLEGEALALPERALIKQRKFWYKMEQRSVPPLLFAYLGRRNTRFIKNEAGALPLTGFLCVYPIYRDEQYVMNLWQALNHPHTLQNLSLVGKSYGSGAVKVEPRNLDKLPIPDHVVALYNLKRPYVTPAGQLNLFREDNVELVNL